MKNLSRWTKNRTNARLIFPILLTFCWGCASLFQHKYVWSEYTVDRKKVHLDAANTSAPTIVVTRGAADNRQIVLGRVTGHTWEGSLAAMTDAIAVQLTKELKKRNYPVVNDGIKKVQVTVAEYSVEYGRWNYAYHISLDVTLGNGSLKRIKVRNSSPQNPDRGVDGAIALAVTEVLNDPGFATYISH